MAKIKITQVKSGNIKMIGITNEKRVAINPNFEAIAETLPGWLSNGWFGYIAPVGTPAPIVAKLNDAINFITKQIASFAPIEQTQARLERQVKASSDLYDTLSKRYELAQITGALGQHEAPERAKIIDFPNNPPARPSSRSRAPAPTRETSPKRSTVIERRPSLPPLS